MPKGYLSFILHAHLPFVRHPRQGVLEERWLYEAITESYLPLIRVFRGLLKDETRFHLTLSLSPSLITMLNDPLLQQRYYDHLNGLLRLTETELERTKGDAALHRVVEHYHCELKAALEDYVSYNGNLLAPLANLRASGALELITCCATHGYLPLMRTDPSRRAQVEVAVNLFTSQFGQPPPGIWLPECGYVPGVDEILKEYGLRYFIVDTHGILNARPSPACGIYTPVYCPSQVAAFGRDPESSRQVWDRVSGYPGDYHYREFYRDIGYDLNLTYLEQFLPTGGIRADTGLKYYRITGPGPHKELYRPEEAAMRAAMHADDFIQSRLDAACRIGGQMERPPVIVAPYDAELFGHWWYEGPTWLDLVLRKISFSELATTTPGKYLEEYPDNEVVTMDLSSWGAGGYSEMWLNPENDWIYRHLHRCETRMVEMADYYLGKADQSSRRVLNAAARELLLAQSSDWPFIIKSGTNVRYAVGRINGHILRFNALCDSLRGGVDEKMPPDWEKEDMIFPELDFSVYSRHYRRELPALQKNSRMTILMFSWEFPPRTVGGLGRAVYDLSRAIVHEGHEVHVVTAPADGVESYTCVDRVHVHRVDQSALTEKDFLPWVDQLNNAMLNMALSLSRTVRFDVVHGHDWLVGKAVTAFSEQLKLPLVITIHATEHGRHRGIHNDLQREIHSREGDLMKKAEQVILCSRYMAGEVSKLFDIGQEKLRVIPNGVDPLYLGMSLDFIPNFDVDGEKEKLIAFWGRLVPEKGVQVLLGAMPDISAGFPSARLVIGGRGPYEHYLKQLVRELHIEDRVKFAGFLDNRGVRTLLKRASVAVFPSLYEPFGIVALEAMAARVPVIVSDSGGLMEVVEHGIDGFKVCPGRPDLLAQYVKIVLDNPDIAAEFCRRAWNKVLTVYDWKYLARMTLHSYHTVCHRETCCPGV